MPKAEADGKEGYPIANPDVLAYFDSAPPAVRERLLAVRAIFLDEVPDGEEAIKYRMPTILWNGNLVHYAAFKDHLGVYPLPETLAILKDETAGYKSGKGSIQFPHDKPLPLTLIRKIVRVRMAERRKELEAGKRKPKKT